MYKQEPITSPQKHPWLHNKKVSRLIVALLLLPTAASLIGIFSNTIPSIIGIYAGVILGALLGIFWVSFVVVGYRHGCYRNSKMKFHQSPILFTISSFLIGLAFGYAAFAWTVPWLGNIFVGIRSTQDVTVIGWRTGGRGCSGPDIGVGRLVLPPRALCMPSQMRSQMPVGTRLRIVGPATIFGINADSVSIIQRH